MHPWTQKKFERRYEAHKAQGIEVHKPLPGYHEPDNQEGEHLEHIPDTVLIADSGEKNKLPPSLPKEKI